jgi:hypothetical protein
MSKALPPDLLAVVERLEQAGSFDGLATDYEIAERASREWLLPATLDWLVSLVPLAILLAGGAGLALVVSSYLSAELKQPLLVVNGVVSAIGLLWWLRELLNPRRKAESFRPRTPATRLFAVIDRWRMQAGAYAVRGDR